MTTPRPDRIACSIRGDGCGSRPLMQRGGRTPSPAGARRSHGRAKASIVGTTHRRYVRTLRSKYSWCSAETTDAFPIAVLDMQTMRRGLVTVASVARRRGIRRCAWTRSLYVLTVSSLPLCPLTAFKATALPHPISQHPSLPTTRTAFIPPFHPPRQPPHWQPQHTR